MAINAALGKFLAIKYFDRKTSLYFENETFESNFKPEIPGIEYTAMLHYEPLANIKDYTNDEGLQKLTDKQIKAIEAWLEATVDLPGHAYDPLRDNVYTGYMSQKDAELKNYGLTYVKPKNNSSRFNLTIKTWEIITTIICPTGIPHMSFVSIVDDPLGDAITENPDATPKCTSRLADAVLMFTAEEWEQMSKDMIGHNTTWDFKTKKWIDTRDIDTVKNQLVDRIQTTIADTIIGSTKERMLAYMNDSYIKEDVKELLKGLNIKLDDELVELTYSKLFVNNNDKAEEQRKEKINEHILTLYKVLNATKLTELNEIETSLTSGFVF